MGLKSRNSATQIDLGPRVCDIIPGQTRIFFPRGRRIRRFGGDGSARQIAFSFHKDAEKLEPYTPGDPTGFIHWPAYARTDQLLVKKKQPEIQKRVHIYFECLPEMDWPTSETLEVLGSDSKGNYPTKYETACRLALDICLRHLFRGDRVALSIQTEEKLFAFQLNARSQGWRLLTAVWPWKGYSAFKDGLQDLTAQIPRLLRSNKIIEKEYIVQDFLRSLKTSFGRPENTVRRPQQRVFLGIGSQLEFDRDWSERVPRKTVLTPSELARPEGQKKHARSILQSEELDSKLQQWLANQEELAKEHRAAYFCLHEGSPLSSYTRIWENDDSKPGVG